MSKQIKGETKAVGLEKKTQLTQAQKTQISDQNMLREATKLILEIGTTKTTLKDVSIRAGYSRGFASARFGSKDGLFLSLEKLHRIIWKEYLNRYLSDKTGLQAVLARVDAMENILKEETDNVRVMYLLWFDSVGQKSVLDERLSKFNKDAQTAVMIHIKEGIKSGDISKTIEPKSYALKHMSEIFGLVYLWMSSPDTIDICACLRDLRMRVEAELKRFA